MDYKDFVKKYNIQLTQQQEAAVQSVDGASLILAVPGSGKTMVLVIRIGFMILCSGISPDRILAITYSREAAKELKLRFASIFGDELAEKVHFGTINSLCYSIIKRYNPDAFDVEQNTRVILKNIIWKSTSTYPTENEISDVQTAIQAIKNKILSVDDIKSLEQDIPHIDIIYKHYCNALKNNKTMDYDDQIIYANLILSKHKDILDYYQDRYRYILVDEAQDTSKLQFEVINKLSAKYKNVFYVGDDDQSIYGFRGADPSVLLGFKQQYRGVNIFFMETNFRSSKEIVRVTSDFISNNQGRYPKRMIAHRVERGLVKRIPVRDRSQQYSYLADRLSQENKDTAILYRDTDSIVPLVDLFLRHGISYKIRKNGEIGLFSSRETTEVISYLKLLIDPYNAEAFLKIYYRTGCFFSRNFAVQVVKEAKRCSITVMDAVKRLCHDQDKISTLGAFFVSPQTKTQDAIVHYYNFGYAKSQRDGSEARTKNRFMLLEMLAEREHSIMKFISRFESLPDLIETKSSDAPNAVTLSTIHSSKGKEYDTVIILDVFDGIIPSTQNINNHYYQEERRLFYVALTRAKNNLFILSISGRKASFISEIFHQKQDSKNDSIFSESKRSIGMQVLPRMVDETYVVGKRVTIVGCGDGEIVNTGIIDNSVMGICREITVAFDSGKKISFSLDVLIDHDLIRII